jgi:hypothetical protein
MNRSNSGLFPSLAIPTLILVAALVMGPSAHGQNPNFTINAIPAYLCVNPGIDAKSSINLQSVDGFAGAINLGDSVDPTVNSGPTVSRIPSSEVLSSGQTVSFDLTVSTTSSTPLRTYYVTVAGISGASFHQVMIQLTVSSGCSVGGSMLGLDRYSLLSPYLGIAVSTLAIALLTIDLVTYRAQKTKKPSVV